MTNEEIKEACALQYERIKEAHEYLTELRTICKHEKTFEGNYSYRIGVISPAIICEYCGELIKYK